MAKNERWVIKECECDREYIRLHIAWKFDPTTHITDIIAICRTKTLANKYCEYEEARIPNLRTWVDEVITDHLLGSTMFGKRR